ALRLNCNFAPACMEQRYKLAQIMQDRVATRECYPGHCGAECVELVANVGDGESRAMLMHLIGEHRVQGVAVVGEQPIGKECCVRTACYVVYSPVLAPCSIRSARQLMYILHCESIESAYRQLLLLSCIKKSGLSNTRSGLAVVLVSIALVALGGRICL